jgi:hypothetical protein
MVLDTTGISTRRGIGLIRHLAWTEITTLQLKSIMAGTYLPHSRERPDGVCDAPIGGRCVGDGLWTAMI